MKAYTLQGPMSDVVDEGAQSTTTIGDPVDQLIRRGEHPAAARLAVERGELARAIGIFQRVWNYTEAIPLALQLGDLGLAIELAMDANAPQTAREIAARIPADEAPTLVLAARVLSRFGSHFDAGVLAERARDWLLAADCYRRAGDHLAEGRMNEVGGRIREAGVAYELALSAAGDGGIGIGDGDARSPGAAHEALGRLLGRLGQHREAARALQRASASHLPEQRLSAMRALLGELAALNLPVAVAEIGARIHREFPEQAIGGETNLVLDGADGGDGVTVVGHRRFRIVRMLGAGATSQVFWAEDTLLGHDVALKLLAVGAHAGGAERIAYERFAREAEAIGRLRHPNIVALFDANPAAGMFVMEHMLGGTLAERLTRDGALPPGVVRRLALDLLSGLGAAHERGIVHRDVKPANILFDFAGNAKLTDFGAAHLADFGHTQTAGLMGTVAYMSPEQISGSGIGPPADLYAAGVTLFEALTGQLPFPGPDIVAQHLGELPPRASDVRVAMDGLVLDPRHDEVLQRALEKDPQRRYSSAQEMAEAIADWPGLAGGSRRDLSRSEDSASVSAAASDASLSARKVSSSFVQLAPDVDPGAFIGHSPHGTLFRREDARLQRPVLVEHRTVPVEDDPAGLQRIRNIAGAGGPFVQRVLSISNDGRSIAYEWIEGERVPLADVARQWLSVLLPLATSLALDAASSATVPARVAVTLSGPVLLVCEPSIDDPSPFTPAPD